MKRRLAVLPMVLFCGAGFLKCSEPAEDLPRLEFLASMPKELVAGDTTEPQMIRKVFVDPRGRQDEASDYKSFTFTSSDTAVIRVVDGRRLLGVKAGQASISAFDNQSDARTKAAAPVTVMSHH